MTTAIKVLITGAGGTVGSALVAELARASLAPRLGFHSLQKQQRALHDGFDAVQLDYAEPATLSRALDGMDAMFLLSAGLLGQAEAEASAIELAKRAGVKHVVKLSVWNADAQAYTLGRVHRAAERALEDSGLQFTLLRANGFMQNFITYMRDTIAQGAIYQPAADAAISHVDVRDIAAVAAAALTSPAHAGRSYDLSGPQALSYHDAARTLARVLGRPVHYQPVSDEAAHGAMVAAGVPDFYADALVDLNRYYRSGAGARVSGDVATVTGRPATSFERFVTDHRNAWS